MVRKACGFPATTSSTRGRGGVHGAGVGHLRHVSCLPRSGRSPTSPARWNRVRRVKMYGVEQPKRESRSGLNRLQIVIAIWPTFPPWTIPGDLWGARIRRRLRTPQLLLDVTSRHMVRVMGPVGVVPSFGCGCPGGPLGAAGRHRLGLPCRRVTKFCGLPSPGESFFLPLLNVSRLNMLARFSARRGAGRLPRAGYAFTDDGRPGRRSRSGGARRTGEGSAWS